MKLSFYLFGVFFLVMGLSACIDEPEFSDVPAVTNIEEIYFVDVEQGIDSLVITIAFEDGDGDLGLTAREGGSISPFDIVEDSNGDPVVFDPLTADVPFNCCDYAWPEGLDPIIIGTDTIFDTIRVNRNQFVRNFEVAIFNRQPDGSYLEVDFCDPDVSGCRPPLGGRFPPLKDDFSDDKPRVGTITFFAQSRSFRPLFRNDSLKFGVVIRDRSGNESEMFVTENAIALEEITRRPE
ncbi:hypothetical protein [Tunicatimonas pelagia]|uniref:hypothetical protein n=1 Tax=Tunicatimonas pelagia TaxID=931531 RepID=UPI002666B20C|nr:hypothetical protein [Tunicatimonas pelagia]WKN42546.1 hypothetical protein P0M28_26270 [Tunicatimonas pelagia]